MVDAVHKPSRTLPDPVPVLVGFLDPHRTAVVRKLDGLSDDELRTSRLPSGWAPIELLKHLVFMERRWLVWGFLGEPIDDPGGDEDAAGRWSVDRDEKAEDLIAELLEGGVRTRAIVAGASPGDVSAVGGKFTADDDRPRPTLAWILVYVLQEYARHAGHLDVARELVDAATGE
jgi:uncharacterized protein DUF664